MPSEAQAYPTGWKIPVSPRSGGRQSELQGRSWQRLGLKEAIGSEQHIAKANLIRHNRGGKRAK
jgi:hypothetical protein